MLPIGGNGVGTMNVSVNGDPGFPGFSPICAKIYENLMKIEKNKSSSVTYSLVTPPSAMHAAIGKKDNSTYGRVWMANAMLVTSCFTYLV